MLSVVPKKLVASVVPALPNNLHAVNPMAGAISNPVLATPLIFVTKLVPLKLVVFVLMIFTPVPATPFTVVNKVLAVDVFDIVDTAFDVAAIPFTVLVKVFPDKAKVLVVAPVNWLTAILLTTPAFDVNILSVNAPACKPFKRNGFVPCTSNL